MIAREGWSLVQVFQDRATSGASALRAGYQAVLEAARDGGFDVLVAEALDRLSRDQEDVAGLFKRLRFAGIRIVTLAEGEVSELHVGLKGTMNALFLEDLAAKTHRGQRGRVEAGKSAGGLCYGYRVVRAVDPRGELIRGDRVVDDTEAATIVRIFRLFADGASPIAIAKVLNAEKVPGPRGEAWRDTTIRGHALRRTGILRCELYVGRLVWNRMKFIKDPGTGRRISRMNPPDSWVIEDVPHLRIVDDALWERVQRRLGAIRTAAGADKADRKKFWEKRRAKNLLTGKLICGVCGGTVAAVGADHLACTAARRQGVCSNRRSIRRGMVDRLILDALRTRLMQPDLVAEFIREFTVEWNRQQAEVSALQEGHRRELIAVTRKLSGLVDAIADGFRAPGLQNRLDELENRRAELERLLHNQPTAAPVLHPNLAAIYRNKVQSLHDALREPVSGTSALEAIRGLIDRVVLHPVDTAENGMEIELIGEIAAMVALASHGTSASDLSTGRALFDGSVKVVAGIGFEPMTFRL